MAKHKQKPEILPTSRGESGYRLTIERIGTDGDTMESHTISSECNASNSPENAIGRLVGGAIECVTSKYASPPEGLIAAWSAIDYLGFVYDMGCIRKVTEARGRWNCSIDFDECVKVIVDELNLRHRESRADSHSTSAARLAGDTDDMTPEQLIKTYGDQAYWWAIKFATMAVEIDDREGAKLAVDAAKELMRRGYHKFPKQEPVNA